MAAQKLDIFERLDAHCLEKMQIDLKRALILYFTLADEDIAKHGLASESTIKARLTTARAEIALALGEGETLTSRLCGYPIGKHRGDCLKDAAARLKSTG